MLLYYFSVLVSAIPNSSLSDGEGLTLIKYLGAACAIYAAMYLIVTKYLPPILSTWQARFYVLMIVMVGVSYIIRSDSAGPLMLYSSFTLLLFMTSSLVNSLAKF